MDNRPHIIKAAHFEKIFPYELINNEWKDKFPVTIKNKASTYNPDYYCRELECYIELATSKPNISEQGPKWREAIKNGVPLRVYWWEGEEITQEISKGIRLPLPTP